MASPPRSAAREIIPGFLLVCAVATLLRWPIADVPLERDEGEYAYIAQRWWLGEVPYRDSFDQKPPATFAAYAVILRLLGESVEAIHWGTHVWTLGTLALIALVGRRLSGTLDGLLAALFAGFMTAELSVLGNAANTETFMILPLTAAFLATLRSLGSASVGWAVVAGAASALALLCKQVALPNAVLHAVLLLAAGGPRWRLLLSYIVGGALGLLPAIGYFASQGALVEFWDCVVGHNLAYAQRLPLSLYPAQFMGTFQYILRQGWPIVGLAVVAIARPLQPPDTGRFIWRVLLAWLLFSGAGVCAGGYFRQHYFIQAIPPVAVLAGRGAVILGRRWSPLRPRRLAIGLSAASLLYGTLIVGWYYWPTDPFVKSRHIYGDHPFPESFALATYLRDHSAPSDTVFVFGSEPQVLYYAQRRSASRYIFVYPLMTSFADTRQRQQETIRELVSQPPRFLVVVHSGSSFLDDEHTPTDLHTFIEEFRDRSYRPVAWMALNDRTVSDWPTVTPAKSSNIPEGAIFTVWQYKAGS